MKAKLKTRLIVTNSKGEPFMGIGLVWLLQKIDKYNSIKKAAEAMDMSYMKAAKILKRLEENTSQTVLKRYRGGNDRGGAELTDYGRRFLEQYEAFQKRSSEKCQIEFKRFLLKISGK